jgi:hypothetical protein
MSPFNWIDKVMEEVGEKVGRMLSEEASRDKGVRRTGEETMIEGLKKKYPGWMPAPSRVRWLPHLRRWRTPPHCLRAGLRECEIGSRHQQGSGPDKSSGHVDVIHM